MHQSYQPTALAVQAAVARPTQQQFELPKAAFLIGPDQVEHAAPARSFGFPASRTLNPQLEEIG